ncbi:MAG: hypothetical protein LAN70_01735 [Acidobacteriia bacterium]|nr:hypothetical protein [Terriglobia bacterium]
MDEYVRQRQIELAVDLEFKKAVYLDVKFWIILRDVAVGRRAGSNEIQLLHSLRECVSKGKVFCPVSDSTFAELLKQNDPITRKATANLIDELSLGVTIIPFEMRVGTELAHFLYAAVSSPNDLHPLKHLVWSKQSYVLGYVHPTLTGLDEEAQVALQKEFFNHMWTIPMSEIMHRIGDATPPDFFTSFGKLADDLNVQNTKHASEVRSFEQAYLVEIQGAIDVFAGTAVDIIRKMFEKRSGYLVELSTTERSVHEREVRNLLFAAFKQSSTKDALRTLHILACIHAFVRWNKPQQLKDNDFFDFRHATAALGYCDAFFTERSMRAMISANHMSLDRQYGCCVVADVNDAIDYLARVANESPSSGTAKTSL